MRFDDTLETVLAADLGTAYGMQSAWRQLVDLIGRRRVGADPRALSVLRRIRADVPMPVRQGSARGLEFANPPAALVRILALDEIAIALPVLRSARLTTPEWIELLPDLAPPARAVLRNRRDLSPVVRRALEAYGPIDFVLRDETVREVPVEPEAIAEIESIDELGAAPAETAPEIPVAVPEPEVAVQEPPVVDEAPAEDAEIPLAGPDLAIEAATVLAPHPMLSGFAAVGNIVVPPAVAAAAAPVESEELPPEQLVDWTDVLATPTPSEPVLRSAERIVETPREIPEPMPVEAYLPDDVTAVTFAETPSAPAVADEVDLSFVDFAEGLFSAPANPFVESLEAPAVQSGTGGASADGQQIAPEPVQAHEPAMAPLDTIFAEAPATSEASDAEPEGPFQIAEVVARIDAFWRNREDGDPRGGTVPRAIVPALDFRFETDAKGMIRWVEGVSRAPIVGLSLDLQGAPAATGSRVDGIATGAFRRRAGFSNARLQVDGDSDASGAWLISAIPVFDPANGRFTGYRGTARRPRTDERAEPVQPGAATPADSLRQLVHELRTPTNAIAGFAEMIETQMLGPVSDPYRDRATVIRSQAKELLGAIDDLDLAARIDSDALSLAPGRVALRPVLAGIADDLTQLAALRGSAIALPVDDLAVSGDRRAIERLLARLMATLVSASGLGERIGVRTAIENDSVAISIDRPAALADYPGDSVLGIDDEGGDATLLGMGFALRLARNLARELGGSLVIEAESLTLRLPASENTQVGQAHQS